MGPVIVGVAGRTFTVTLLVVGQAQVFAVMVYEPAQVPAGTVNVRLLEAPLLLMNVHPAGMLVQQVGFPRAFVGIDTVTEPGTPALTQVVVAVKEVAARFRLIWYGVTLLPQGPVAVS